jgi:nucleotide-binding universal stress UspA family protein
MKKLLLATDLSPRSELALRCALRLAREHRAAVAVIHIVDEDLPPSLAEVTKAGAEQLIRAQLAAAPQNGQADVAIKVASGKAFRDILAHAADEKAELIVLGMHREGGAKEMFRGTTAERVIRTGGVPVLVVKREASESYRRVVVATDFSVHARRAMQEALRLAAGAELRLVHAFLVPFQGLMYGAGTHRQVETEHQQAMTAMIGEEMKTFLASFEGVPPRVHQICREGMAQEVILKEVVSNRADLLVLGTHGRTGVAHAFLGSVAEELLAAAPCDVLVARAW